MILVDTNVLGELCRRRPAPAVERWAARAASPFALSVVTIEEIRFGLSWKPNRRVEAWFERFFAEHCEVLGVTAPIARRAGALRAASFAPTGAPARRPTC